jgi:hypothetical protein
MMAKRIVDRADPVVILRREPSGKVMGEVLHTDLERRLKEMSVPVYLHGDLLKAADLLFTALIADVESGKQRYQMKKHGERNDGDTLL